MSCGLVVRHVLCILFVTPSLIDNELLALTELLNLAGIPGLDRPEIADDPRIDLNRLPALRTGRGHLLVALRADMLCHLQFDPEATLTNE